MHSKKRKENHQHRINGKSNPLQSESENGKTEGRNRDNWKQMTMECIFVREVIMRDGLEKTEVWKGEKEH